MTNFEKVKTFMKAFGQEVKNKPNFPDEEVVELRLNLINEEFIELVNATQENSLVDIADALSDLLYVVYGAGHTFGLDLDKCFEEVHRSNMSKLGEDGNPIYRKDGKILKGTNFREPDLKGVLYEWFFLKKYN